MIKHATIATHDVVLFLTLRKIGLTVFEQNNEYRLSNA
jgi:hypothetical protein